MSQESQMDEMRRRVLAEAVRSERAHRLWIIVAAIVEGICLLGYVLLADFGNRVHVLLLISSFLVYGTLAAGLLALGAFMQSWCRRIIQAIELLDADSRQS